MRPHCRQILSVEEAFGQNGWHGELVEGRDVMRAAFEGHHTRVDMIAQAYPQMNALAIVTESKMPMPETHLGTFFELLMRANKQLNLGSFEYDLDREFIVFRISNLFEKEKYDAAIIQSMVHCAIAELDRIIPYASIVRSTAIDLLDDLDVARLLMREDILPPSSLDSDGEEEEDY